MLKKHEDEVKTTKSVQRKADDRPWQRESSGAQPASTSPDPARGDKSKGTIRSTEVLPAEADAK
jgi:hypothetical protein